MIVAVDVLDFWSIFPVLKNCPKKCKFYYLLINKGILGKVVIRIFTLFDREPISLESYLADEYFDIFQKNDNSFVDFMINHIEPDYATLLKGFGRYNEEEIKSISRYVRKDSENFVSRICELIQCAFVFNCKITLLIQHSQLLKAFVHYSRGSRVVLKEYYAPGRVQSPMRKLHYHDGNEGNPSLLYAIYKSYKIIKSIVPGLMVALWRYLWRFGLKDEYETFDILALVSAHGSKPSPGHNTIFWSNYIRKESDHKILTVCSEKIDSEIFHEFYFQQSDRFESIRHYGVSFYHLRDKGSSSAAKIYFTRTLEIFFFLLIQILNRKIPILFGMQLLRLENCAFFYASLLKMTSARLLWHLTEGNSIDSVSMTLASNRFKGVCLATTWSLYNRPESNTTLARSHIFFVWGKHHQNILERSKALSHHYVESGYPTIKYFDEEHSNLTQQPSWMTEALVVSQKDYIVTFYDNICGVDFHDSSLITCKALGNLYSKLLDWLVTRRDVLLILKTKRLSNFKKLDETIHERVDKLSKDGTILVRDNKADIGAGLGADVVLGLSLSTLACISAAYGKRCILCNPNEMIPEYSDFLGLPSIVHLRNVEKLHRVLDKVLSLPRDTSERGGYIDSFADNKGDERIAYFMIELLRGLNKGLDRIVAIESAKHKYRKRWPVKYPIREI